MTIDTGGYSLSIFTLEADRKAVLAIAAKTHVQAEQFCSDERVRTALRSAALCDDYSILRVRLARADERAQYHERSTERSTIGGLHALYLDNAEAKKTDRPR